MPTSLTIEKFRRIVDKLFKIRHIDTVLDVGCGDGHLLSCFKDRGVDAYGTEYDMDSADIAASRGVKMLQGGLAPSAPRLIDGFDAILFSEVIEHINNPVSTTSHLFRLLRPGGVLYLTTPNFCSFESSLLGPDWGMVMYPEHLCYYNPRALHRLLSRVGFERIDVKTENISFFRLAQFWSKQSMASASVIEPEEIAAAAQSAFHRNIVLRMIKIFVNKALGLTGTGSQLIAIYRKPLLLK